MRQLRHRDLPAIHRAYHRLITPLSCTDTKEWRRHVLEAVTAATGTERGGMVLRDKDHPGMIGLGFADQMLDTYTDRFHQQTALDKRRIERRLLTWTRSMIAPLREFEASDYYNQWCRPQYHLDSAGMTTFLGRGAEECVIYISAPKARNFRPDGREQAVLRLLQPALAAGARAALLGTRLRRDWSSALDALPAPALLVGVSGRIFHATPAAHRLLAAEPDQAPLLSYLRRWAREFAHPGPVPPRVSGRIAGAHETYALRATLLESGPLADLEPAVLYTITPVHGSQTSTVEELRHRYSLTAREAQVAVLLGEGLTSREIAERLQMSVHTARRHSEHIFAKLGARRRAEVAAIVTRLAGPPNDTPPQ
jgi:DNA-binding CsgD family transcriptional regulator